MPANRTMPPRNQRNSNKPTNSRNQGDAQSFPPNQQLPTNESPKLRKKRIQISDQIQQPQQQRQSVFERLGTKNSVTAPLLRQAKVKKEIKDYTPVNELRKSRRISDSRKAERELSDGELTQEIGKLKDRQPIEIKSKTESSFNKNLNEPIKNITINSKNTLREDLKSDKSSFLIDTTTTYQKDQVTSNLKDLKDTTISRARDADNELSEGIHHSSSDTISNNEVSINNDQNIIVDLDNINLQKPREENLISIDNSNEITIKKRKTSHDDIIEEESEDAAKEDVVSIQADDDFSLHSDLEESYSGYLSPPDDGQLPMDQDDFIDIHEKASSQTDSIQGRERNREKELRIKDNDPKIHDMSSRIRNRQTSDDGRLSEKDNRIIREPPIPPHKDDRRRVIYDRESREKFREERYNRVNAPIRDHRDHRPHDVDRERRERERQERYNQSILEDKAHFDQRRTDRDRFLREDRGRSDHGNRTPTADTSSNSTVRGGVLSRSSSVSDRDRGGPSRGRSLERLKKDERLRDDISRDREYPPSDYMRERDRIPRQRDDSQRDREQRLHDDLSKDINPNIRKVDDKEVAFRRLDDRLPRRLDDHHQISTTSDRPQRELLNRDREKDNHYQRDALRIESTRRDERTSNIRQKNDPQNDSVFQDNRNRDREPVQRNIQQNVQTELDRTEKRKKEESEVTERKPYLDKEQRGGDSIQSIQRLPEYRSREKDRDVRQRDDFVTKDTIRLGINRDQERELPNRRDDRTGGLPDLYRPSSDHHLRDTDRRPIREFDRDYRDRDLRVDPIGIDRYRGDYGRDNNQGRDRILDNTLDRHPREIERRLSWELDNRVGTGTFSDKDQMELRRERERERTREVGHKSRSNSVELKTDSHKHLYEFHQREPERRTNRDVENDQMARTNRTEIRRVEPDRHSLFINDKHHDSSHNFISDTLQRDEQNIEPKDLKGDQIILRDEETLPDPWQKCMSKKNKVYYFNTQTRESRWTFPTEELGKPENSYHMSPAQDYKRIDEYETHNTDDAEIPRKKPRLKSRESADEKFSDDRKDPNNRDTYERKFGYEDQSSLDNFSTKGTSLRDQKVIIDLHTDTISRRPRSNTTSNVVTSSPSSKSQTSPSMTPQFSPTHRSPAPGYDRRYSADYDNLGGSRRVPYNSSQLQSPPTQLRSNSASFNRNTSIDFYERNDNFRIDDFNSHSRGMGNMSGGNNNTGMKGSPGNSQTNINNRSNRFMTQNNSYGVDQGAISGNRRTSMGRGGMSSSNHSTQLRVRPHEDDRNIYNGNGDRMETFTEIDEFKNNNRNLQMREFGDRTTEKSSLANEVSLTEANFPNETTFEIGQDTAFIASDEEAWRTEDEMVDDVLANTEPESLFLFRRSVSPDSTSHPLSDEDILRRQIAPIWNHITSSVAGDELFQQFEQIMNSNSSSPKKKKMRILNSRKEFEQRRAMFGGKGMFRLGFQTGWKISTRDPSGQPSLPTGYPKLKQVT